MELPYLSKRRQRQISGIYSLHVEEHARRLGIATSLIGYLFSTAHDLGIEEILVGTTIENTPARKTYKKAHPRAE